MIVPKELLHTVECRDAAANSNVLMVSSKFARAGLMQANKTSVVRHCMQQDAQKRLLASASSCAAVATERILQRFTSNCLTRAAVRAKPLAAM